MADEKTTITQITSSELEDLFSLGEPTPDKVIVDTTKSLLNRNNLDENDLNLGNIGDDESGNKGEKPQDKPNIEISISELDAPEIEDDKLPEKDLELAALEDLVKSGEIFLFDGDKALKDYTKKERTDLIKANIDHAREEEKASAPAEFFDAIPLELQYAAKYFFDGGKDLKSLFKYLAQAEEVKALDITTEKGQEDTVRTYLKMQGDLSPQEIEEEVTSLKDLAGALEKKAVQYKPKLDAKQQQLIDKQIKEQEMFKVKQDQAVVKYRENVMTALSTGDLNGVKLNKNTQGMLYAGLIESVDGFRELLKTIPGIKTDYNHLAEVYWLLKDPNGFKDAIKAVEGVKNAGETMLKLKTAAQQKTTVNTTDTNHVAAKKTIPKKGPSFFART